MNTPEKASDRMAYRMEHKRMVNSEFDFKISNEINRTRWCYSIYASRRNND